MSNRSSGRRWVPWVAAAVLVALLAGFDQGAVIVVLALVTGALGLVLLLIRGYRRRGAGLIAAGLVATLVGAAVLGPEEPTEPPAPSASAEAPSTNPTPAEPEPDSDSELRAVDVLALLEVKGRAPKTDYDRDAFAYREVDLDRNGCDTRNDILNRDLQATTHRPGTGDCVVLTGMLAAPYSGEWISFVRGADTSSDVQIDHVVSAPDTQRRA